MATASHESDPELRRHALHLAEQSLHDMQAMLDDLAFASRLASGTAQSAGACTTPEVLLAALDELSGCSGADNVTVRTGTRSRMTMDRRVAHMAASALLGTALKMARGADIVMTAAVENGTVVLAAEVPTPEPPAGLLAAYFVELAPMPGASPRRTTTPGLGLVSHLATSFGGAVSCEPSGVGSQRLVVHLAEA